MRTERSQESLPVAFARDLLDGRAWAGVAHLLLAFPLGLAYFLFIVVGSAVGIALAVTLVGFFILAFVVGGVWVFTAVERELAVRLLGADVTLGPRDESASLGPVARLQAYLANPSFWKGLAYLLAKLPWGLLCFSAAVGLLALSLGLLAAPLLYRQVPLTVLVFPVTGPLQAIACAVGGVGVLWVSLRVLSWLASLSGRFAAFMLSEGPEARRRQREAEALACIASSVAYAGSLRETLDELAGQVREATAASACAVLLLDEEDGPRWRAGGASGLPDGFLAALEASYVAGAVLPSERAVQGGRGVLLPRARESFLADERYAPLHPYLRSVGWDTLASVPLVCRGKALGTLAVYYGRGQEPHRADAAFLGTIADQAAVAVENARLIAQAQDRAALEERQRLARELHDSVSQALFGIALGARTAKGNLERDPARAGQALDYVLSLADGGIAEMRALIFELRPESLAAEGLAAAVAKHAAALEARHGLRVTADLCPEPALGLAAKEALYRAAQEAMHNAVRHARATTVTVGLAVRDGLVLLTVSDDGAGFDPASLPPGQLGLRGVRERLEGLGGSLTVTSAPGSGTRITAALPLGDLGR